ncbi:hypothetical protein TB2_021049 [Malus domestica]
MPMANEGKVLAAEGSSDSECNSAVSKGVPTAKGGSSLKNIKCRQKETQGKSVSASVLSWKLRWNTLGLQSEWSKVGVGNYDVSLPYDKIPDTLCQLAKRLAKPAMPLGEEFQPEGAIVNYFDHLDDMEFTSVVSSGCKSIFLLGGKLREDPLTAMFLRSGDVVLMARKRGNAFMACLGYSLTEKMLKLCLLKSSSLTRKMFCVLEYIPTSRININIRPVF